MHSYVYRESICSFYSARSYFAHTCISAHTDTLTRALVGVGLTPSSALFEDLQHTHTHTYTRALVGVGLTPSFALFEDLQHTHTHKHTHTYTHVLL